jgi:hypothetical protein
MKRIINGKTYEFMFCILPSGCQGLIYKIEGEKPSKIYQINSYHGGDLELVQFEIERDIRKGRADKGVDGEKWRKHYNESIDYSDKMRKQGLY